jgi:cell division GTPase FtsZ
MKPCIVGIGGAGGKILKLFLQCQDAGLAGFCFGEHLTFGEVKGVWLDSAAQDAQNQKFYGNWAQGKYPGYLICHDLIDPASPTREYIRDYYGYDLKAQGYDRRAEYLKGIFEIFDTDIALGKIASEEFAGEKNPLAGFMWKSGIRPFTTISKSRLDDRSKQSESKEIPGRLPHPDRQRDRFKRGNSSKLCDSILFIASLGGGTGTGFINPITSYVRSEELAFPIFSLAVLTEKGTESREASEGQRDLGAVIAMQDLLTKKAGTGIDGLILIDNQILVERYGGNFPAMDQAIYNSMRPFLDIRNYPGSELQDDAPAMRRVIWEADRANGTPSERNTIMLPPLLVPCYHFRKGSDGSVDSLVEEALSKSGRLFPCDPARADRAYVFTRGFFKAEEIDQAVQERTGLTEEKVKVYRKIGNGSRDVLVLLRNPYGGISGNHEARDTLEWRIYGIISEAIRYLDENSTNIIESQGYKDITNDHLRSYFYGDSGLREELSQCLERLKSGKRPVFLRPMRIFNGALEAIASVGAEANEHDEALIRKLVREELISMMRSDGWKKR